MERQSFHIKGQTCAKPGTKGEFTERAGVGAGSEESSEVGSEQR